MGRARRAVAHDDGFSLVELMVVVLVISILISIAVPVFLGARQRAQDRAAQTLLRHALVAEKEYFADTGTYSVDTTALHALEPAITFVGWGQPYSGYASAKQVQIYATGTDATLFASISESGKTFLMSAFESKRGSSPPGVYYSSTTLTSNGHTGYSDPVACNCGWKTNGW